MAGKIIRVFSETVVKIDGPSPGRVAKQAQNLRAAAALGFIISPFVMNEGKMIQDRVQGPSLGEVVTLSSEQTNGLLDILRREIELSVYLGDLNYRNLLWEDGRWFIIDCGAVQTKLSSKKLQRKLRQQLSKKWRGKGGKEARKILRARDLRSREG